MKTIIAGSRTITDMNVLINVLSKYPSPITEVVCGLASGVDSLGLEWGNVNNIPVVEFPAKWQEYGKSAGMIRNKEMADYADSAIIIWDGKSKGTKNLINIMTKLDKPFYLVIHDESTAD